MLCSNVIGRFEVFERGSERGNEFALSDERNWGILQPKCFILGFWSWGQCFVLERVWRGERDNAVRLVIVLYTWSTNWFLWDPVSDIKVSVWIEKLTKIFHPNSPPNRVIRNWGIFEWWVISDENWVISDEWWKKLTKQGLRVLSDENITKKSSQTEVLLWVPHILSYGWWKLSYITQFSQNPNSP